MNAIVCIQEQLNEFTGENKWAIGNKNHLLFHYKNDMNMFKQQTLWRFVIMGRKTFDSLPKMLPNRVHIVISSETDINKILKDKEKTENLILVHSYDELFEKIADIQLEVGIPDDDFWIIGGEKIYNDLLPYCRSVVLTKVRKQPIKEADKFFPNIDELHNWKCTVTQVDETEPLTYYRYVNNDLKIWNKKGN